MPVNEARRFRIRLKADGYSIGGKAVSQGPERHDAGIADAQRLANNSNAEVWIPVRFLRVVRNGREETNHAPPGSRAFMDWRNAEAMEREGKVKILDHWKAGWKPTP